MKESFEDKLVRLAFGETTPKETSALTRQAQTDPEKVRMLQEYKQVRIGLNLLNDIPPDQLSKERLRNAILEQGLKPLPAAGPSRWTWAWMPATAFALAFGWLNLRHMHTPAPVIVQAGPSAMSAMRSVGSGGFEMPAPHQLVRSPLSVVSNSKKEQAKPHSAFLHRSEDAQGDHAFLAADFTKATNVVKQVTKALTTQKSIQEPEGTAAPMQSDADARVASINTPMVVINPENDNNSGAQKATEVDGASNVVVGG